MKPAMLQINARGAWRNVCRFDVADKAAADQVMEAAATIAEHSIDKPTLRVVKDEGGYAVPLMSWKRESGWKPWRTA
jgi:hypothetical protein